MPDVTRRTAELTDVVLVPADGKTIFAECAEDWLDKQGDGRPRTAELYRYLLGSHITPNCGNLELSAIAKSATMTSGATPLQRLAPTPPSLTDSSDQCKLLAIQSLRALGGEAPSVAASWVGDNCLCRSRWPSRASYVRGGGLPGCLSRGASPDRPGPFPRHVQVSYTSQEVI